MKQLTSIQLLWWGLAVTAFAVLLWFFAIPLIVSVIDLQSVAYRVVEPVASSVQQFAWIAGLSLVALAFLARLVEFDPDAAPAEYGRQGLPVLTARRFLWWGIGISAVAVIASIVITLLPLSRSVSFGVEAWTAALSLVRQFAIVLGPVLIVISLIARIVERQKRSRTDAYVHFSTSRNSEDA